MNLSTVASETENLALLEQSRAGSLSAFDELMRRHERFIFKIAFAYIRDAETAMEIVQNVFVKTFYRLADIRSDGNFRAWLAKVACRESIDSLRRSRRHAGEVPLEGLAVATPEPGQEEDLIRARRSDLIRAAVGKLNPKQQVAVSLRYFEGASLKEIADRLECDVELTKNILFRSLEKLRRHLGPLKECL
jgi:RNA polymerase sigma-70 factor (ECF subfamily)